MKGAIPVVVFSVITFSFVLGDITDYFIDENDIPEFKFMNTSANPCDDFYEYTCGNFKNINPLQNGELSRDNFLVTEEILTEVAKAILELPELPDEDPESLKKARAAYHACIQDTLDSHNMYLGNPELEVIKQYGGFPIADYSMENATISWLEIADMVTNYGVPLMFSVQSLYDSFNASEMVIYISNDPIGIPKQVIPTQKSYEDILEEDLVKFSRNARSVRSDGSVTAMELFLRNITLKISKAYSNRVPEYELYNRVAEVANFMRGVYQGGYIENGTEVLPLPSGTTVTLQQLNDWTKESFGDSVDIDWVEYFGIIFKNSGVEIKNTTKVMYSTTLSKLLYGMLNLVKISEPGIVKSMALLRIFLYMAVDSDAHTREAFEVYMNSIEQRVYPREEYCTRKLMDSSYTASFSFALTYEYQLRYYDINKLNKALEMLKDIKETFYDVINSSTWIDDESKARALQKAENMIILMGFPDTATNKTLLDKFYENVEICKWNNYNNTRNIRAFRQAYQLSHLKERNRETWEKSPFEVNAYYNRQNNKITLPLAMLTNIFFNGNTSIFDYSRIGMIIGHEMTHGFDQTGSKYNEDGAWSAWWTTETQDNFSNQIQCFIDQYSTYYNPEIDAYVDGTKTIDENLADNGGLNLGNSASKKLLSRIKEKYGGAPYSQNFTSDQLFYIGFGTMWCNNESQKYLEATQINCSTSCYANNKWRVNGAVSNIADFSNAFNCPVGSNMNPEKKCKLW